MTEKIKQTLRESSRARWTALVILSFTMFAGYMFTEVISPMKPILERNYAWDSADFGTVTSAYGILNVFLFMLVIVGILLDKFGIRISTIASVLTMIVGATLKWYAFKGGFSTVEEINFLGLFKIKEQVFFAALGFSIFGVGVEYAGITVSKSVAKWFKGKEIALAMGMQVAIARLGSFAPLAFGAYFASTQGVPFTILVVVMFLILGLIGFFYYNIMDKKLDKQIGEQEEQSADDEFKLSDIKVVTSNRGFWLVALLCVLFYGAVFPFYKYGGDLMVNKFGVSERWAGLLPSLVPFGTMFLTPFFGSIYDKKGKGATLMILGSIILIVVHVIFYLPFIDSVIIAFFNVIILGIGFSLVPSAMWPSVPKIIPEKQLGSAYALIFWVQNFGLWGIPLLVGLVLNSTNPTIVPDKTLVNGSFQKAYVEVVNESPLIGLKDGKGKTFDETLVTVFAKSSGGEFINKVVMQSPQEEVIEYDKKELEDKIYTEVKSTLQTYITAIDKTKIDEINDKKEIAALVELNQKAIDTAFEVIKASKVKLNYNYQTTWTIFVVLTIVALLVAFMIKAEDKRKGYGLELPNIQKK